MIDAEGSVAALSSTLGSGAGVFRHGFQLNNMLGELDVIGEVSHEPGARLPSMMTPSLRCATGRHGSRSGVPGPSGSRARSCRCWCGSSQGGSAWRRRSRVRASMSTEESSTWRAAGGRVSEALEGEGWEVVRWADRNLFFGGTSAVELRPDGRAGAAGDPRRGGRGEVLR